jgi:hypothetical protein
MGWGQGGAVVTVFDDVDVVAPVIVAVAEGKKRV